jgi:hypothetical protein
VPRRGCPECRLASLGKFGGSYVAARLIVVVMALVTTLATGLPRGHDRRHALCEPDMDAFVADEETGRAGDQLADRILVLAAERTGRRAFGRQLETSPPDQYA